jgi:hypothetical protein
MAFDICIRDLSRERFNAVGDGDELDGGTEEVKEISGFTQRL